MITKTNNDLLTSIIHWKDKHSNTLGHAIWWRRTFVLDSRVTYDWWRRTFVLDSRVTYDWWRRTFVLDSRVTYDWWRRTFVLDSRVT
jgi:hypothetical protein